MQQKYKHYIDIHLGKSPKGSMYGIFPYIYHKHQPTVGKYTILDPMGMYISIGHLNSNMF